MKLILPICLLAASQLLAAVPTAVNYQGRLTDGDGNPASGSKTFSLKIHDAATGGNEIYTETIGSVVVDANGIYNFQFGANGSSVVDISDTVAVADGSATSYTGSLTSTPLTGTLSVTDGTYSWNSVDGNPGEQAAATAQIANGFVIGATVTNGGEGYTEAPSVTIDGDGSGATATAVVENGSLTAINIDTTGSGYTSATVVIAEPSTPFVVDYGSGDVTVTYETAPPTATEITASYQASDSSIRGALSAADSHWLELTINGEIQAPRERVLSVPFAFTSLRANNNSSRITELENSQASFGSLVTYSVNTSYTAPSDGFVILQTGNDDSSSRRWAEIVVGGQSRAKESFLGTYFNAIVCPVREGEAWKAQTSHLGSVSVTWLPIGPN